VIFGDRTTSDGGGEQGGLKFVIMPHGTLKKIKESQYRPARPTTGTAPLWGWAKVARGGWVPPGKAKIVQLSAGRT
jgi:hypothetical protein